MTERFVGIRTVNSPAYVEAVFGCYQSGEIVVPLQDDGVELPPQITLSRRLAPKAGGGWLRARLPDNESDAVAQISFSSGTEGKPKGIVLSHRALLDVVKRLNRVMAVDDTIREYVGIPVYYSFGLGRCRAIARAGGAAYIPGDGFNLSEFAAMLETGEVNALSAVPTLLRLVIRNAKRFDGIGARLRWLEIGSQYISEDEKRSLMSIFPNAVILLNYGLTEASRTTLQVINTSDPGTLSSVGTAKGEVEIGLSDDNRIRIRGPNLASYLWVDGKKRPLTDADGWFTTGDIGEIIDGHLYFRGRADDLINVAGIKVSAEVLEQALVAELPQDAGVGVVGVPDPLLGEAVFVAVEGGGAIDADIVKQQAEAVFGQIDTAFSGAVMVGTVDSLPRTRTNKLRRGALRQMAGDLPQVTREIADHMAADDPDPVLGAFRRQFPDQNVTPSDSLRSLGGTSLDFIEMELELETVLGHLPADWQLMPICDLTSTTRDDTGIGSFWLGQVDQLSARALCCILVVLAHVVGDSADYGLRLPQGHPLHDLNGLAGYFKMPLFAFVSGMTFALIGTAQMPPRSFLSSTFKTVALPTILTILLFAVLSGASGTDFALGGAWWVRALFTSYAHFWFIQSLLTILLLVYAAGRVLPRAVPWLLAALVIVPLAQPSLLSTPLFGLDGVAVLGPFFALGIGMTEATGRSKSVVDRLFTHSGALALVAVLVSGALFLGRDEIRYMPDLLAFLVGVPLVLVLMRWAGRIPGLRTLAPYTFYIFLWHVFFTSVTRRLLDLAGVHGLAPHLGLGLLAGIAGPVAICLGLRRLGLFRYLEGRW
ncbi:AMP-binding protein [Shimia biformata]|uniref:AMP-binding protein n=1 Tax=Shimia biformata TaxID=1294299 RepID=UPI0019512A2A|nr:AMP-binding protein [Shimia biformata]